MPLETVSYISDLVITNPEGADQRSTADDHLRNIKKALSQTFPNIAGLVSVSHTELNRLDGISANIETRLDADRASISAINTTISGMTTTLNSYGASISAINTTISGITTTLAAHSASLSELSTNVMRVQPPGGGQKIYHSEFSYNSGVTVTTSAPIGWSATITSTGGRIKLIIDNGGQFDFTNSCIPIAANRRYSGLTNYSSLLDNLSIMSSSKMMLDTGSSASSTNVFQFACIVR